MIGIFPSLLVPQQQWQRVRLVLSPSVRRPESSLRYARDYRGVPLTDRADELAKLATRLRFQSVR
jgi:hypothetical protein